MILPSFLTPCPRSKGEEVRAPPWDNQGGKVACSSLGEEAQAGHLDSRLAWSGRGHSEDCAFRDGFCVFCGGKTHKLG